MGGEAVTVPVELWTQSGPCAQGQGRSGRLRVPVGRSNLVSVSALLGRS